jgi:hypothetical protein
MASVDLNDESIDRWVVQRYRFDPERNERRHVPEIAFDSSAEMEEYVQRASIELYDLQQNQRADDREHYSGVHWAPGHRERMNVRRLEWQAVLRRNRSRASRKARVRKRH